MTTDQAARECAAELFACPWPSTPEAFIGPIARHMDAAVESETAELRSLLTMFVPTTPCSLDHNGNCQEHGWFNLDADNPCPVAETQKLLGKAKP